MVDWVDGTLTEKRKLHNLMTMSMQPVIFGGIVEIDLNTFINVNIVLLSYSYESGCGGENNPLTSQNSFIESFTYF